MKDVHSRRGFRAGANVNGAAAFERRLWLALYLAKYRDIDLLTMQDAWRVSERVYRRDLAALVAIGLSYESVGLTTHRRGHVKYLGFNARYHDFVRRNEESAA